MCIEYWLCIDRVSSYCPVGWRGYGLILASKSHVSTHLCLFSVSTLTQMGLASHAARNPASFPLSSFLLPQQRLWALAGTFRPSHAILPCSAATLQLPLAMVFSLSAGADISLYTSSGHGTTLNVEFREPEYPAVPVKRYVTTFWALSLPRTSCTSRCNGETCLHVAAGHGQTVEVLLDSRYQDLTCCRQRYVVRAQRGLVSS